MELEVELTMSYNDKCCLVERAERRIGAPDGTDGDRAVGRGVSVDRHSHARSPTRLLAASVQPSLESRGGGRGSGRGSGCTRAMWSYRRVLGNQLLMLG